MSLGRGDHFVPPTDSGDHLEVFLQGEQRRQRRADELLVVS